MEKKKLFIIVGILLLTVGVSFSYFVSQVFMNGTGGKTTVTTAQINGANLKVEGTLNFSDENIYPGHSSISGIKVTATGNNELVPYNLIWNGTNSISALNYKVYKISNEVDIKTECEKKMKVIDGAQVLSEFCEFTNLDKLGEPVETEIINKDDTKVTLVKDEFITATSDGQSVYYYVILEFPNLESIQNADSGGNFNGKVTVEESDKQPDINILAFRVEQEDGSYKEQTDIPDDVLGEAVYRFNQVNSTCSNGAIPGWDNKNKRFYADNLTKSGTSCYLTFDRLNGQPANIIFANIISNAKAESPNFTSIATTDEGVYRTSDGMYGGYSYYWRGAATTNHVIFANKCWRIIRINGDGTIRLIYNGSVSLENKCADNGLNTDSIAQTNVQYNTGADNSSYVGWSYTINYQRPNLLNESESNIKVQTENWFNSNIIGANLNSTVEGKFCNDRNVEGGWRATGADQYYKVHNRLSTGGSMIPTLYCSDDDVYTIKAGAITADEVQFAGASWGTHNVYFYLYNGQYFWTMSPSGWVRNNGAVFVLVVQNGGCLDVSTTNSLKGIRPVINLKSDVLFATGGSGTVDNPYIVVD